MRADINLTIQDYFAKARPRGRVTAQATTDETTKRFRPSGFARELLDAAALDAVALDAAAVGQGGRRPLSIQDYFRRPLPPGRTTALAATDMTPARRPGAALFSHSISGENRVPARGVSPPAAPDAEEEKIRETIEKTAARYDLRVELLRAVVKAESNYDVRAVSPAGARGLMQLMPATARELGVEDAFDIEQNIDGGARYLRRMLDRYDGDLGQALSAYNAGPGAVDKYNGRVPYPETRAYVAKVLRLAGQGLGV